MKKLTIAMLVMMVLSTVSFAVAQEAPAPASTDNAVAAAPATTGMKTLLIPLGTGLVVIGGAFGISRIGAGAVDAMARQPEYAGAIQTGMILSAALIEGATLFALVICLLGYIF